jgi:hypothetical protein
VNEETKAENGVVDNDIETINTSTTANITTKILVSADTIEVGDKKEQEDLN